MKRHVAMVLLLAAPMFLAPSATADPVVPVDLPDVAEEKMPPPAFERVLAPGESFETELEDGTIIAAGVSEPEPIAGSSPGGGGDPTIAALPTAYCTWFWQTATYAAYKVKNEGVACYNGRNVWIKNSNYPNKEGWHKCRTEWAVGYDVTHKCWENKNTTSAGKVYMNFWDDYRVCFVTKYLPLCVSNWMRARVWEGGGVGYAWD